MKITTYIYGIWGLDIQKFVYIGKSNKPLVRFKVHMKRSASLCFRKLVEEKGVDSFELIMLERTIFFELRSWVKREKFWIKKFRAEGHPLCNKNSGGGGITEHTEEVIARIRAAASNPSDEARDKMSKTKIGANNPNYGKKLSQVTLDKISFANSGENHWDSSGENNGMFGKHHTQEAKDKTGKANAKPYPAFYNVITGEYIPPGINISKLSRARNANFLYVKGLLGKPTKIG